MVNDECNNALVDQYRALAAQEKMSSLVVALLNTNTTTWLRYSRKFLNRNTSNYFSSFFQFLNIML